MRFSETEELKNSGEEVVTKLWEDYENASDYLAQTKLSAKIPLYRRFFEGDQWAKPTSATKNMPRPVVNIVKMICRTKTAMLLSTPVRITYQSEGDDVKVEKFNRFADFIQKEIGQDRLDMDGVEDAVQTGTYVYHYYWDTEAKGKRGVAEGGLRCELIDPLNIRFSDPTEKDEQKQRYIIIASREDVSAVRAKADKGVDLDMILPDDIEENPYQTVEQKGSRLCTVLTRYFRRNGEVFIEKSTKNVVVNEAFPLTPDVQGAMKLLHDGEDAPNTSLPDDADKDEQSTIPDGVKAWLYPIVVGNYEGRSNSIYGLSEVEGLIPNQRAINFNLGMMLYAVEQNAWGKIVVRPNALQGQVITNDPAQVLIDWSNTGDGIKYLLGNQVPSDALKLVDTIANMTRAVTGSTEVMTGEVLGANMSGSAIAQLQSQAQMPVERLRKAFWEVKERQGKVMAQFFRLYYTDKEFSYQDEVPKTDEFGKEVLGADGKPIMEDKTFTDNFNGSDYDDAEFSIVVEATAGTNASIAGDISALDVALQNKAISIKTYFKLYPNDAISNRKEILETLETEEANAVASLEAQIEALGQQLEQANAVIDEQKSAFDKVQTLIQENTRLKMTLGTLYGEALNKVDLANQIIAEQGQDAQILAQTLARQSGMM